MRHSDTDDYFTPTPSTTVDEFRNAVNVIDDEFELSHIRDTLRASQRPGAQPLPGLVHPKYGLGLCYKKLDERATECNCTKYSFGYRKTQVNQ